MTSEGIVLGFWQFFLQLMFSSFNESWDPVFCALDCRGTFRVDTFNDFQSLVFKVKHVNTVVRNYYLYILLYQFLYLL